MYMKNTASEGLRYYPASMKRGKILPLFGMVDASFGQEATNFKSTYSYCFFYLGGLILWTSKKVGIQCISTNESEYYAAAECGRTAIHLRKLGWALGMKTEGPVPIGEDNQAVLRQVADPEMRLNLRQVAGRFLVVK